ncbi:hypothetical protein G6045_30125 [Streptomyces sp. YC504]|uniref:Uncharacterized protein n=1 Tax=Streptomyces mesophilus TaxID=1775132 RepID=A0A6G4XQQ0_9ACTN|nr:hypothetical protein [Streptomyces mesophilus]NGO79885.1 hypothetical protein [Streptomyces mesophilus]
MNVRKVKNRWRVGLVSLIVAVGVIFLAKSWMHANEDPLRGAESDVVGQAEVLYEFETSNASGGPEYKIEYLVLNTGGASARKPLDEQHDILEARDWTVDPVGVDGFEGFDAWNTHRNAGGTFRSMASFLGRKPPLSEVDVFRAIESRFDRTDPYVVAAVWELDPGE